MKKFTRILSVSIILMMFLTVTIFALPEGNICPSGTDISDGNIFFIKLDLVDAKDVRGGQGCIEYDENILEVLDVVCQLPGEFLYDTNTDSGKLFFVFYAVDNQTVHLSGNTELFNIYFEVKEKPDDDTVLITVNDVILSDGTDDIIGQIYSHTVEINNFIYPDTSDGTKPYKPKPPVTTSKDTETDIGSVSSTGDLTDNETLDLSSSSLDLQTEKVPSDKNNSLDIIYAISFAVICALISGGIVYIIMNKKKK